MTSTDAPPAAENGTCGRPSVGASPQPAQPPDASSNTAPESAPATAAMETTNTTTPQESIAPARSRHESPLHTPTVSPLSSRPVTRAPSLNGDNAAEDDMSKPASDQIQTLPYVATNAEHSFAQSDSASGFANGDTMTDLGNPQSLFRLAQDLQRVQMQHSVATVDDDESYAATRPPPNRGNVSRNASLGNVNPDDIFMSLNSLNYAQPGSNWPNGIAPSDISLQASYTQESDTITGSGNPGSTSASASRNLESFARLEFNDSVFHMNTYAVIIGRDQRAMDQARENDRQEDKYKRKVEENAKYGLPPPTPKQKLEGRYSKSYVSEEGGMLGPESDDEGSVRSARRRRPPSSAGPAPNGENGNEEEPAKSNRQYVSQTEGAIAVDLSTLQSSRLKSPTFVGIHSPGPNIAEKTKKISRQHLRIEFNEQKGVFEAFSLHKNGFFREEHYCGLEQNPVILRSGDHLQIKDVEFTFIISGVEEGKTGAEEEEESRKSLSIGGKEMSFDFEHSDHRKFHDTDDELSDVENVPTPPAVSDDEDEDEDADADADADLDPDADADAESEAEAEAEAKAEAGVQAAEAALAAAWENGTFGTESYVQQGHNGDIVMQSAEVDEEQLPPDLAMFQIPKRRGPGRPPKDGIMSKRERRELKKKLLETSRKTLPQEPPGEKIKRPVGRPRKNPLPEDGDRPEKRKYTKRKKEDGEECSDPEKRIKDKKDKKVRPKSPPLDLKREDFTEAELQKPSKNYGVLIDEALTAAGQEGLTLKQIYKRITAKYPWFYFHAETKGWESSVRHNLIGNEAFKKDEQTSLWSRVPGVELDAGKKRKPSSPDRQMGPPNLPPHHMPQQYFHNGNFMQQGGLTFTHGLPAPTYPGNNQPNTGYQAHATHGTPQYAEPANHSAGQPTYATQNHIPSPTQPPAGVASSLLSRQPAGTQQSTYSSPYARPPPPAAPGIKVEHSGTNTQAPLPITGSQTVSHASSRSHPPTTPSNPASSSRPQLHPEVVKNLSTFRKNVTEAMALKTDKANQIVETAFNRALGLPAGATLQGFEPAEQTIIDAVHRILKDVPGKQRSTTSASPAPAPTATAKQSTPGPSQSPGPAVSVEAEVQKRIKIFRDSMVTNLKAKLDKAEAIVDAAIKRAQGLPNPGPVPGFESVDKPIFERALKIINEARKTHYPAATASPIGAAYPPQSTSHAPPRQTTSASPAPVQPSTPSQVTTTNGAQSNHPVTTSAAAFSTPVQQSQHGAAAHMPAPKPPAPLIPRPGFHRPPAMSMARPPAGPSVARPASLQFRKDSISATSSHIATALSNVPAGDGANTTAQKIASPAPPPTIQPSAGAIEQITGHNRIPENAVGPGHGGAPSTGPVDQISKQKTVESPTQPSHGSAPSTGPVDQIPKPKTVEGPTQPSHGVVQQITGYKQTPEGFVGLSRGGAPSNGAVDPNAEDKSLEGQTQPSAGAIKQTVGHKRSLEGYDGPGNGGVDQPESKKVAVSSA